MKQILALCLFAALPLPSFASDCSVPQPWEFLVYSRGEIAASRSDYQGLTGAGSRVRLSSFEVRLNPKAPACPALISGGDVEVKDGKVIGGVDSSSAVRLTRAEVQGTVKSRSLVVKSASVRASKREVGPGVKSLSEADRFFRSQSRRFADAPVNGQVQIAGREMVVTANESGLTVVNVTNVDLQQADVVRLRGSSQSLLVVNVSGEKVDVISKDIVLEGLTAGSAAFNFFEAKELTLRASGHEKVGIATTILAPFAATLFSNGLITGGLYVGSLCGDGQVNADYFRGWLALETEPVPTVPPLRCEDFRCD